MNFVVNGHHSFGDIFFKINWKSEIKCSTNEVPNETFVEFQLMKTKFPLELFPTERKKELNKINDKNSNAKNKHYKIKTCSSVPVIWNISLCRKNLLVVLLFWINYTHIWMKWNWENIDRFIFQCILWNTLFFIEGLVLVSVKKKKKRQVSVIQHIRMKTLSSSFLLKVESAYSFG